MRKKVWKYMIGSVCVLGLLTGCGKDKKEPVQSPPIVQQPETETQEALPVEETQETVSHEGEARSLFTGEWIDEALVYQRPVAVMTENTKVTLPQYGLGNADVIYECPVEGGITRLMAIYQDYSGMEKVGNVRSCRLYYVYFAKEFDAIYFHAGESKYALDVLNSSFIDNVDGITGKGGAYYYRDNSRKAPHNLYTTSEMLVEAIEGYGFSTRLDENTSFHYQFATEDSLNALEAGEDAAVVSMYYVDPKPWFEYNSEDGKYYRYEFGAPQVDALTGEQLAVTNIIIQNCYSSLKDAGNGTLDIDYQSGGAGKFITGGKAVDITWSRESANAKTRYYDTAGNEIVLNPGTTWVEIVENARADKNVIYSSKEEFQ
ncbi:MAG: DUF3048 domain-containing protein [Blautia sp.]|nr:DUF3048 domain-containing protein [Blautia sp.]